MKIIFTNDIGVNLDSANLMCFYFLKDYYPYEVWDVSEIFNRKGAVKNIDEAISVDTIKEFEQKLTDEVKVQKVVIITNMVEKPWKKLSSIAKRYNVPVISTQKNSFYEMLQSMAASDLSINIPIRNRVGSLIRKYRLTRYLYNKARKADVKYDYLVGAYNSKPETAKKFVKSHNVKYDEYLSNRNSENVIGEKYILFIDCALCYHPIDFNKPDPNFSAEHYIQQLNHYFDLVEQKYKMPVVISLHPVSFKSLSSETFGGRKVSCGNTAQLIHHAEFTISHFSTSLINVIFEKKPAVIISSKEVISSERRYTQAVANVFAKLCCFAKDSLDNPSLPTPSVKKEKYDKFIDKYLIDSSRKDMSNGEIILDLLKQIEHEA